MGILPSLFFILVWSFFIYQCVKSVQHRVISGLTKNVETALYTFRASGRSRNPTANRKDSSLQQYLTASSRHAML